MIKLTTDSLEHHGQVVCFSSASVSLFVNGLAGRVNALLYGESGFSNGHLYDRVAPGAEGMWPMGPQLFQKWRLSG